MILRVFIAIILFHSVGNAQQMYKDPDTGLGHFTYDMKVEQVYLAIDDEQNRATGDQLPHGSTLYIVMDGVEGWILQEDKAFVRLSLVLKEVATQETILYYENLFEDYENSGISAEAASRLVVNLTLGDPMTVGKRYYMEVWAVDLTDASRAIRTDLWFMVVAPTASNVFFAAVENTAATPSLSSGQGLAQVKKIEGFDIYMFSTPTVPYEEVFRVSGFWNWGELIEEKTTLDNIVRTMVRNARRKNRKASKKDWQKADGIIITDNESGVGIRYKR